MTSKPSVSQTYRKGADTLNFVVYRSTTGAGEDEVLQHKILGVTESAHLTLHPDGTVNLRVSRNREPLVSAVRAGLAGWVPAPSERLKLFLVRIRARKWNQTGVA
jgi:hypothetical protein